MALDAWDAFVCPRNLAGGVRRPRTTRNTAYVAGTDAPPLLHLGLGLLLPHRPSSSHAHIMNDNLLIALDRIKFYAQDALVTVTQVSSF